MFQKGPISRLYDKSKKKRKMKSSSRIDEPHNVLNGQVPKASKCITLLNTEYCAQPDKMLCSVPVYQIWLALSKILLSSKMF